MNVLFTIVVTFFAGMGAGLGTGFAGMSAAAVISPMLIAFLGMATIYAEATLAQETRTVDKDGNVLGSVVVNVAKGYGGDISVMTGVDKDGKVTGVNILSHSETAGLGANAVKESFRDQFVGLVKGITVSKDKPGENSIDALTGATVTSRAVTKAVNAAIEAAGGENDG